jgi:phosphopantothenoylcysteine decarboxylase / phosphopantothenate---cysteine ligase
VIFANKVFENMKELSKRLYEKNILVGVTGSVALYKTLDLIRLFVKSGAMVRTIMTPSAKRFISPLLFEAITHQTVLHEETESWSCDHNHIQVAQWANLFIIAPISANTLNKLAVGIADTLLLQTALAYPKTLLLAPAANTHMIEHPTTQKSIDVLRQRGAVFAQPLIKQLACNDIGKGAMAEPETIYYESLRLLLSDPFWKNRSVIISGGGTREKIDSVRCISNFSSGKMALSLAYACYMKGSHVTLVTTQPPNFIPQNMRVVLVDSSEEMHRNLQDALDQTVTHHQRPYLLMAAAVSDYRPVTPSCKKLKKKETGQNWTIALTQSPDILTTLIRHQCIMVGFKAETEACIAHRNAKTMLHEKTLDAVCLNVISSENPFGGDETIMTLITHQTEYTFPKMTKIEFAHALLTHLQKL